MANVKRCDSCGAIYDKYAYKRIEHGTIITTSSIQVNLDASRYFYTDLCPECMKSFYHQFTKYEIEIVKGGQ